jgi:hypothetical protein
MESINNSREEFTKKYASLIGEKIASARKGSNFYNLGQLLIALNIWKNPKWNNHVNVEAVHRKINYLFTCELKEHLEGIKKEICRDMSLPMDIEYHNLDFNEKMLDIIIPYLVISISGFSKLCRYYKVSKIRNHILLLRHFSIFTRISVVTCFPSVIIELLGAYKRFKHKDYLAGICKIIICLTTLATGIAGVYLLLGELNYGMYKILTISLIITVVTWIIYILFRKSKEEMFLRELGLWM